MDKLTEQQFKELISWMSADEMIDMMPETIDAKPIWYPWSWYLSRCLKDEDAWCFYIKYTFYKWATIIKFYSIDPKHACTKMLLRLFKNNYFLENIIDD